MRTPSPWSYRLQGSRVGMSYWECSTRHVEKKKLGNQKGTRGSSQGPGVRTRGMWPEDGGLFPRSSRPPRPREPGCALPPDLMFTSSQRGGGAGAPVTAEPPRASPPPPTSGRDRDPWAVRLGSSLLRTKCLVMSTTQLITPLGVL